MTEDHVIDGVAERRDGDTLVVTLVNPARRNAFTPAMRRRVAALVDGSAVDESIRAIVLRGDGAHFCSGADISAVGEGETPTPTQFRERMKDAHRIVRAIAHGPKPVIAAVEGGAFGAGLSIAAACDIVVAAEDARFGVPFVTLGIIPDLGLLHSLSQRIGRNAARRMILLSQKMDGPEALRCGLADVAARSGGALDVALGIAGSLRAAAPLAIAAAKAALSGRIESLDDALRLELDLLPALATSADFREGVAAFKEKRPPRFTGR